MKYLNIKLKDLEGEEFVGCEPLDRATWLCLMRYSARQETGGVLKDAKDWGDRKWMQLAAVTKDEVERGCTLWEWQGDDLHINLYPADQERNVRYRRVIGRLTGSRNLSREDLARLTDELSESELAEITPRQINALTGGKGDPVGDLIQAVRGDPDGDREGDPNGDPKGNPQGDREGNSNSNSKSKSNNKRGIHKGDFSNLTLTQKKRVKVSENSDLMKRIGTWFSRRETTLWSIYEAEALADLEPLDPEELELMDEFYSAEIPDREDTRRHSLETLLNNWSGEIDKARRWKQRKPGRYEDREYGLWDDRTGNGG